ncbi:PepSY domain-containing protein [Clostridium frigidicarnis]|uniref:Peptidase propeptide and YPEB domain-containing protein n=1 Tax=Clostridium frigidicarnis TaxID=84698 RepID=A0A1I0XUT6_9CLOT|nr:PepSY domain-containing protein [Clostridium frigidicarnis]SFB04030.1 Peptidase propeptide and YPEB domain-containing protein [Clostridium frigidicarnis]
MKYKTLSFILLFFTLFLTSCSEFDTIKKDRLIVETIDSNTSLDESKKEKILSEEEAKLKALEILERYFDVKLYLTEVDCNVYFLNPSTLKPTLNKLELDSDMKFENSKSVLENGIYRVEFFSKENQNPSEKHLDYYTELDAKTGEIISFNHYIYITTSKNKLDMEDSENIAKEFIEKNNIGGIKNAKLTFKSEIVTEYNTYNFTFEDNESESKKVNISIDANSKKIASLSIGIMTRVYSNY